MSNQVRAKKKSNNFKLFKIIKQNGYFICGVCRRNHKIEREALTCLKNCGSDDLSSYQIDQLHVVGKKPKIRLKAKPQCTSYRCKYCKRTYEGKGDALECAASCKPLFAGKHRDFLEFRNFYVSASESAISAHKTSEDGSPTKCSRCNTEYSSEAEAKTCFNEHAIAALKNDVKKDETDKQEESILLDLESIDTDFDFHDSDSFVETASKAKTVHKCPVCKQEYDSEEDLSQCYSTHFD